MIKAVNGKVTITVKLTIPTSTMAEIQVLRMNNGSTLTEVLSPIVVDGVARQTMTKLGYESAPVRLPAHWEKK